MISLLVTVPSFAKRVAPAPVKPVVQNGIEYSAPNTDGRNAYVIATDRKTGKVLWKLKVFHTRIKPLLEEDVQWVFVTQLALSDDSLFARDEKSRCYRLNIKTRHIDKVNPRFCQ